MKSIHYIFLPKTNFPPVEQELITLSKHLSSLWFLVGFMLLNL
jgi:hypothetical protein